MKKEGKKLRKVFLEGSKVPGPFRGSEQVEHAKSLQTGPRYIAMLTAKMTQSGIHGAKFTECFKGPRR